ncbi:hypothetical protein MG293_003015, partial [Ovis ammon polii]
KSILIHPRHLQVLGTRPKSTLACGGKRAGKKWVGEEVSMYSLFAIYVAILRFKAKSNKQGKDQILSSGSSDPKAYGVSAVFLPRDLTYTEEINGCSQETEIGSIMFLPCDDALFLNLKKVINFKDKWRGSNVSLTLDMSSLGNVEPFVAIPTPREKVAMEYLQSASRILTRSQLRDVVASSHLLQSEFMEIPMNFVDPKEIDIPRHGTKNRYKTILPNPLSRVCLRPKNVTDSLSTYINANYIRGYSGKEKAFIATQGPMINTVNDFWQMVWQEDSPVIVMITKLKEKNEKCVLYWPEKRGIYGKVEVLVISVNECDNYTVRNLVLKQGSHTQRVKHYWYTSWPDHKTPDSAQPLLQLMLDVEEDRLASAGRGPVVVHCSAGIGRTGCFIATSIGCRQLREEGVVDALSIVCQLRVDSLLFFISSSNLSAILVSVVILTFSLGGGMVQTSEQYEFVHHALCLYESRLSAETVQ